MHTFPRIAALALGCALVFAQSPAQAEDPQIRVVVDVADVVMRNGYPYYRHGGFGYRDRLIVESDAYGRPIYYRMAPPEDAGQTAESRRPSYGHYSSRLRDDRYYSSERCDANGVCQVEYYDPRDGRRWSGARYQRPERAAGNPE
jgi:hypothetical protein